MGRYLVASVARGIDRVNFAINVKIDRLSQPHFLSVSILIPEICYPTSPAPSTAIADQSISTVAAHLSILIATSH